MKKIFIVLLGMSLVLVGCGNLSTKEKNKLITDFSNVDEKLKTEGYTEVNDDYGRYFVKSKYIKGDKITEQELESYSVFEEGEVFTLYISDAGNFFFATSKVKVKENYVTYYVVINDDIVGLDIILSDKNENVIANISYEYIDGELKKDENSSGEKKEQSNLLSNHEKDANKFFEKSFKELDNVVKK